MTTVADGLFQFGGVPVGTNLDTNKIFSTYIFFIILTTLGH